MISDEEVDFDDYGLLEVKQGRRDWSAAWPEVCAPREDVYEEMESMEAATPEVEIKVEAISSDDEDIYGDDFYDRPLTPPLPNDDRPLTPPLPSAPLLDRLSPLHSSASFITDTKPFSMPLTPDLSDTSSTFTSSCFETDTPAHSPPSPWTSPEDVRAEVTRMIDHLHARDAAKARKKARTADHAGQRSVIGSRVPTGPRSARQGGSTRRSSYEMKRENSQQRSSVPTAPRDRGHASARISTHHTDDGGASVYHGQQPQYLPTQPASTAYPPPHLASDNHLPPLGMSTDPHAQVPLRIRVEPSLLQFAANADPSANHTIPAGPISTEPPGSMIANLEQHDPPGSASQTPPTPLEVQLAVISSATLSSMQHDLDTQRLVARHERAERERIVTVLHQLCNEAHAGDTTYDRMDRIRAFARAELVSMGRLQV